MTTFILILLSKLEFFTENISDHKEKLAVYFYHQNALIFRTNTSRRGSDREPERPPRRTRRNPPASGKVRSPSPSVSSTSEAAATSKSPNSLLSEEVLASLKGKTVQLKNAVMMLNEMFPPPRAPQYKVTSQVHILIQFPNFTKGEKTRQSANLASF